MNFTGQQVILDPQTSRMLIERINSNNEKYITLVSNLVALDRNDIIIPLLEPEIPNINLNGLLQYLGLILDSNIRDYLVDLWLNRHTSDRKICFCSIHGSNLKTFSMSIKLLSLLDMNQTIFNSIMVSTFEWNWVTFIQVWGPSHLENYELTSGGSRFDHLIPDSFPLVKDIAPLYPMILEQGIAMATTFQGIKQLLILGAPVNYTTIRYGFNDSKILILMLSYIPQDKNPLTPELKTYIERVLNNLEIPSYLVEWIRKFTEIPSDRIRKYQTLNCSICTENVTSYASVKCEHNHEICVGCGLSIISCPTCRSDTLDLCILE
jgi:hypothetical protein